MKLGKCPVVAMLIGLLAGSLLCGCAEEQKPPPPAADSSSETPAAEPETGAENEPGDQMAGNEEPQETGPGLAVGEKAPAFQMKDQNGELRSLEDALKSSAVALVFYRSADW